MQRILQRRNGADLINTLVIAWDCERASPIRRILR